MIGSSENRIIYNGNGIATEFAYTFKILEKSDIKVLHVAIDGTEELLTKDYYVDMEKSVVLYPGYAPGAEIPEQNRPPILPVGERLVLYREVPITQESALDKHWPFNVIEAGLDKLTIICQQLFDRLQRSFYVSESTSTNFDTKVPIEAGKTFRVKDDGTGFEVTEDPGKVIDGAKALLKQTTEQAEFANEQAVNAQNAANAAEAVAPEYAKTKEVLDNIVIYTNTATEQANVATAKADAASASATNAAQSYANADAVATQLTEYLATKESLTAPAVDKTLLIEGAAADSKVVGELKGDLVDLRNGKFNSKVVNKRVLSDSIFEHSTNHKLSLVTTRNYTHGTLGKLAFVKIYFLNPLTGLLSVRFTLDTYDDINNFALIADSNAGDIITVSSDRNYYELEVNASNATDIYIRAISPSETCSYTLSNLDISLDGTSIFNSITKFDSALSVGVVTQTDIEDSGVAKKSDIISPYEWFKNKNILFLGDSITDTSWANMYPYYVEQITGANNVNYAVASSGFAQDAQSIHSVWGKDNTKIYEMIDRAYSDGINPDFIVVAGGTNDWDFSRPYGSFDDILSDTEVNSFYWYVSKAIKTLIEKYPLVPYLFVIPIPRNQPTGSGTQHTVKSTTGKTLIDYCNALKEICDYYSIPYLDMINNSNMHLESETSRTAYTRDGLHPTDLYSEKIYAPMVIKKIMSLVN